MILETSLLTDDEKATACTLCVEAGADFVKTSTGFGASGATVHDVALLRSIVGPDVGVKASGGIRSLPNLKDMTAAGASRVGASASVCHYRIHFEVTVAVTRKRGVQFREREELLDFLLEISQVTSETLDIDKLLPAVADFISQVITHDVFAIMLYNEKAQGLQNPVRSGHRDEVVRNLVIPLGEGITGIAAATRHPILVNDVRSDPRYLPALDAVRSELAVPMVSRGKLVGVIDIQSTRLNAFTESDSSLLRLIASRVVSSIDNARLYRRVVTQNRTSRMLAHLRMSFRRFCS